MSQTTKWDNLQPRSPSLYPHERLTASTHLRCCHQVAGCLGHRSQSSLLSLLEGDVSYDTPTKRAGHGPGVSVVESSSCWCLGYTIYAFKAATVLVILGKPCVCLVISMNRFNLECLSFYMTSHISNSVSLSPVSWLAVSCPGPSPKIFQPKDMFISGLLWAEGSRFLPFFFPFSNISILLYLLSLSCSFSGSAYYQFSFFSHSWCLKARRSDSLYRLHTRLMSYSPNMKSCIKIEFLFPLVPDFWTVFYDTAEEEKEAMFSRSAGRFRWRINRQPKVLFSLIASLYLYPSLLVSP